MFKLRKVEPALLAIWLVLKKARRLHQLLVKALRQIGVAYLVALEVRDAAALRL